MKKSLKRIISAFCSAKPTPLQDNYYSFDQSRITLCARIKSFKKFNEQELDQLQELGYRRIIYDVNSHDQVMEFLSEHYDKIFEKIFGGQWIFQGIQYNLPFLMDEKDLIKKLDFKTLLQISQHLQHLKPKNYDEQIHVYTGIQNKQVFKIEDQQQFLQMIEENFGALDNIVGNSFSYGMTYNIKHNTALDLDTLMEIAERITTYTKSFDLSVYRYAKPDATELEQNQDILSTIYQSDLNLNTVYLTNYEVKEGVWQSTPKLSQGIVSYKHLFDLLKLKKFNGSLAVQYDKETIEEDTKFILETLKQEKYIHKNRDKITDKEKSSLHEGQTDIIIDV